MTSNKIPTNKYKYTIELYLLTSKNLKQIFNRI